MKFHKLRSLNCISVRRRNAKARLKLKHQHNNTCSDYDLNFTTSFCLARAMKLEDLNPTHKFKIFQNPED